MNEQLPPVASPCVRNCCLNEKDICLGCFRTLNEITGWAAFTEEQRRTVLAQAALRRSEHQARWMRRE
ncbi:MAG: hypothetical protein FD130_469 [Halothiobacillaceae bacterium]|nr:MAG: hypothetical protein FD130_469 [Halothiobacillaceae bacterium]